MSGLLRKFLNIFILLSLFTCSVSAPIIREFDWKITVIEDRSQDIVYEELSIFINCYDEDGDNDIETIFLIDDKDGLYWELNEETWDYKFIDDVKWLGSETIVMPDRSSIPRTSIRIFVRDLAGESVEDKLYIAKSKIDLDQLLLPELIIDNNKYSIKNYESGYLKIRSNNEILAEGDITTVSKTFVDIFGEERDEFDNNLDFYIEINDKDLHIESGPWY